MRGTQSLSDLFADLVGDAEDFAGLKPEHVRCHFVTTKDHHVVLRSLCPKTCVSGSGEEKFKLLHGKAFTGPVSWQVFSLGLETPPRNVDTHEAGCGLHFSWRVTNGPEHFPRGYSGQVRGKTRTLPPLSAISPLLRSSFSFLQQSSAKLRSPSPPPPSPPTDLPLPKTCHKLACLAGGKAHAGILHTARRLLERLHPHLKEGQAPSSLTKFSRFSLSGKQQTVVY